ncbi:MAG: family 16 glycosylhydrolase [Flavobacteriales bacterium]|nr:family 16 glycosylhydrolase [Flavobacteriales bacterium]
MYSQLPDCSVPYMQVFSDEFDGLELDYSKWNVRTGRIRNHDVEIQCYQEDQVVVNNGSLHIIHQYEPNSCYDSEDNANVQLEFTSGEIDSHFRYSYGYYDAKVWLPTLYDGVWPGWWIYGQEPWVPNVHVTEVDIFEFNVPVNDFGGTQGCSAWSMTTHVGDRGCGCLSDEWACGYSAALPSSCADGWLTFGLLWDRFNITWYLNGSPYRVTPRILQLNSQLVDCESLTLNAAYLRTVDHRYPLHPGEIIFNIALGRLQNGSFPWGPNEMKVDYIRYFRPVSCKGNSIINDHGDLELTSEYNVQHGTSFETVGNITLGYGEQIELVAEDRITLNAGFEADAYSWCLLRIGETSCGGAGMVVESPTDDGESATMKLVQDDLVRTMPVSYVIEPNPATTSFYIDMINYKPVESAIEGELVYIVSDNYGREVQAGTWPGNGISIDISALSSGVYQVQLITRDSKIPAASLRLVVTNLGY